MVSRRRENRHLIRGTCRLQSRFGRYEHIFTPLEVTEHITLTPCSLLFSPWLPLSRHRRLQRMGRVF